MQLNADMMFNLFIFREERNDCFARPLCGEYFVPRSYTTTKHNRAFSVPLSGMAALSSMPWDVICRARFIVCLRPSFLPSPGLGLLLRSYLEGALYKFHRYRVVQNKPHRDSFLDIM